MDPEPVPASKARAVFALGLVGLLTGPLLGGVIPATLALLLARQSGRQIHAAGGFLTGSVWVRRGTRLAWAGIVLTLAALVVLLIAALLHMVASPGVQDFAPGTD